MPVAPCPRKQALPLGVRRAAAMTAAPLMVSAAPPADPADRPAGTIVTSNMNDNPASVIDAESGRVLATLVRRVGFSRVVAEHR